MADISSRILKFKGKSVTVKAIVKLLFGIGVWYYLSRKFRCCAARPRIPFEIRDFKRQRIGRGDDDEQI